MPDTLTIEQVKGSKIKIELSGQNTAFKPLKDERATRLVKTWYPGVNEATIQVLGEDYKTLELEGLWDDRYSPTVSLLKAGNNIPNPKTIDLVDALNTISKEGVPVSITWGNVVSRGILSDTDIDWEHIGRVKWRIVIEREGLAKAQPVLRMKKTAKPKNLLEQLQALIDKMNNLMDQAKGLERQYLTGPLKKLNSMVNQVSALVDRAMDFAAEPAKIAKSAIVTLENVKQDLLNIVDDARCISGQYRQVASSGTSSASSLSQPIAWEYHSGPKGGHEAAEVQARTAALKRTISTAILPTLMSVGTLQLEYAKQENPDVLAVHIVSQDETLQHIARKYYQDLGKWRLIADYNRLDTSTLSIGQILLIPSAEWRQE